MSDHPEATRRSRTPRRIFVGMGEVAGYFGALQRGFRAAGVRADFFHVRRHPFAFAASSPESVLQRALDRLDRPRPHGSMLGRFLAAAVLAARGACVAALFLVAVVRYDTFVFAGRTTFFRRADLPLLRFLGRIVVVVFLGSDVRPPYLNGRSRPADRAAMQHCIATTRRQQRSVRWMERWADVVISHPPCSQFLTRPAVNFLAVGIPRAAASGGAPRAAAGDTVAILHSPSLPECKGTPEIRRMVRALRARGLRIEYREAINEPHERVLEEIRRCDIAVDQLYSDTPMAAFATEAASQGRAVLVGGYVSPEDLLLDRSDLPPTVFVHPHKAEEALHALVRDRRLRQEAAERAAVFVRTRWSEEAVARKYLELIRGRAPAGWYFDPRRVTYVHGWGMTEDAGRAFLREFVKVGGTAALCVSDKPELLRRIGEHLQ